MSASLSNVGKLYAITILTNLWFVAASWLFYYRLFMSDRQIGILDGIVFGLGLIAEVPSGALADMIGRKRLLSIGLACMSIGFFTQGFAGEYVHILVGMIITAVGWAFVSGADDALVYDSLKSEKRSGIWQKVIAKKYQLLLIASLVGYGVGDLLYRIDVRYPFLFMGASIALAFLVSLTMHEVHVKTKAKALDYVAQIRDGSRYLLNKSMAVYAIMAFIILGMGYAYSYGLLRPVMLDKFGYFETGQAILISIAGFISILLLSKIESIKKRFGDNKGLILLAVLMGLGFGLAAFPEGAVIGAVAFFMIYISNDLALPWLNDAVQHRVPSSHRATALSTLSLLRQIPYVLIAPIAGAMSSEGTLSAFFGGVSIAIFIAIAMLVLFLRYTKKPSNG